MKKILVLNGSPKKNNSLTMKIVESFLSGIQEVLSDVDIERVNLAEKDIRPCMGCFGCWTSSPGECVQKDDMSELINKYLEADIIIWSTPLYHYGMTSVMKKFIERTLPESLPFIDTKAEGVFGHPYRNPEKMGGKKHILISTCGFPSIEKNYEGLIEQFNNLFGKDKWEKILCVEGGLLGVSQLNNYTDPYLELVKEAGREYSKDDQIPKKIQDGLKKPFVEIPEFLEMANLSWGIDDLRIVESDGGLIAWNFMNTMHDAFNPKVRPKLKAVLQIDFTDIKESYQLEIKNEGCTLLKNDFRAPTSRITTNFTNWERISEGKIDIAQALMEKKFTIDGNFKIMNALVDGLFGEVALHPDKKKKLMPVIFKNTPYWFIFTMIPWIICFVMGSGNPIFGVVIPLAISGLLCAIKKGSELVYFDKTTLSFFSLFALVVVPWGHQYSGITIVIVGFMGLFVIWLASVFKMEPLTADYSHYLVGKNALKNSLFLKTNRIITIVGAIVFLIAAALAYWLGTTSMIAFSGILPLILFIPMLVFGIWFEKWYPSYCGKSK